MAKYYVILSKILSVRLPSVCPGKHPKFRGYFWAILDIIMRYFEVYYSPSLKKWGYTGFAMSFRDSVIP